MSELIRMEGQLAIPGVFTATGLNLPDETTHDEWIEVGGFLARVHQTVAWWVGDWLNFGVEHGYVSRQRYDEAEVLWSQYTRETLRQFAWICRSVQSSTRVEDLSFKHHELVAPLAIAEQREWLDQANESEWTVAELRRQLKNRRVQTPELPEGQFTTIVADPPWDVMAGTSWVAGAPSHILSYATMSVDEIAALQPPAADDAHLYLWTINAYVRDSYDIAKAWGFEPSTLLVWCKPPHGLGLGGTYVLTTEYVLLATRGTLAAKQRIDTSWFQWPRGRHSVKPVAFYDLVESVSPGPYLEMFARQPRSGWLVWGHEAAA